MDKMVEVYLKGREKSTMSSYQSSYKRLLGLCERAKVSIFRLNEESRCELWMEASESGLSAASLRGVCAVVSLVRDVMGMKEDCSGREKTLKRSLIKEKNLKKKTKIKRKVGSIQELKALVKEARRTGSRSDWRVAAMGVLCFFGCRRLGDLLKIRVEDVTHVDDNIHIYLRRQKTDVENEGSWCSIIGRGRAFDIIGFMEEYITRMGLTKGQSLFPKNLGKGEKKVAVSYSRMYQSLESSKERLGLDASLKWHSWRIGAATRGNMLGVRRTVVKAAGLWRSSAVDIYCREANPGVVLSEALANSWE